MSGVGADTTPTATPTTPRGSVRVKGDTGRFYALAGPLVCAAVRRSIACGLRNLKRVLEAESQPPNR